MILEIAADGGVIEQRCDAGRGQRRRRSDPRELQQLRRIDRAAAENHFAVGRGELRRAAADIFHADGATLIEANLARPGAGLEAHIGAAQRRAQEGIGGRAPQAIANRHLIAAEALRVRPVEIIGPAASPVRPRHPASCGAWDAERA